MLQFYLILKNIFFIFVFIFIQSNYIFADKLLVNCGGDFNTFLRNIGEVAINQGIDKNDVFLVLKKTQRVLLEHAIEDKNGMCFDRTKDFCNFNENSKTNVKSFSRES